MSTEAFNDRRREYQIGTPLVEVFQTQIDGSLIRYIKKHNEFLFIFKDIFVKIGYTYPDVESRKFKSRHGHKFKEFFREVIINTEGGPQKVTACTYEMLVIVTNRANTDKAIEFQKRVAKLMRMLQFGEVALVPGSNSQALVATDNVLVEYEKKINFFDKELNFLKGWMEDINRSLREKDKKIFELEGKVTRIENMPITVPEAKELKRTVWDVAHLIARLRGYRQADRSLKFEVWEYVKTKLIERKKLRSVYKSYELFTREQYHESLVILQETKERVEAELRKRKIFQEG
ncbi:MAG: hypothetical protein ACTSX6_10045 [Candidatus Heimdallarchaeaceae archaeon]